MKTVTKHQSLIIMNILFFVVSLYMKSFFWMNSLAQFDGQPSKKTCCPPRKSPFQPCPAPPWVMFKTAGRGHVEIETGAKTSQELWMLSSPLSDCSHFHFARLIFALAPPCPAPSHETFQLPCPACPVEKIVAPAPVHPCSLTLMAMSLWWIQMSTP